MNFEIQWTILEDFLYFPSLRSECSLYFWTLLTNFPPVQSRVKMMRIFLIPPITEYLAVLSILGYWQIFSHKISARNK